MSNRDDIFNGEGITVEKGPKEAKHQPSEYIDPSGDTKANILKTRSKSFDLSGPKKLSEAEYERQVTEEKTIDQNITIDVPYVKRATCDTAVPQVIYPNDFLVQSDKHTFLEEEVSADPEQGKNNQTTRKIKDIYDHDPAKETIIEIPHIQQRVRNNVIPEYIEDPMLIDVPLVQIRAVPKEYIVDRSIPIPVEISIVQEIKCPRLVPEYHDIPLPVHVTRVTEKPVPKDALISDSVLKAAISYGDGTMRNRKAHTDRAPPNFHQIMQDAEMGNVGEEFSIESMTSGSSGSSFSISD